MPDNTNAAIAFFAAFHFASPVSARCFRYAIFGCRAQGFIDCCLYGKELMITGDDFVCCAAIRIVFERNEVADQVEKASLFERAPNECL